MPADETRPGRGATPSVVRRELADFVRTHEQRRRQLPRALVVGLVAGLIAVAFRRLLEILDAARIHLADVAHGHAIVCLVALVAFGALGAAVAVFVVERFAPEASGSGIPHVKAVLSGMRPMRSLRVIAVKFAGGLSGIGAGLALGREGPTVQMGAAVGSMVSAWFGATPRERRTLIAAGAGAGLTAAFNAPLAGLVFVLEEVQRDFAPGVFAAAFIASATADVTTRLLIGQLPVFHFPTATIPALSTLPVSLLLGIAAGLLGVVFNRALLRTLDLFQRLRGWPGWMRGAAVGAGVGVVAWWAPHAVGGGNGLVVETLSGNVAGWALAPFFALRFALTMASYGCGAPGGIFAPLLVLGSEIGLAAGKLAAFFFPLTVDHPEIFAVVGMGAYFSGIVRAPLTGIVLIVEMTGDYSLVLSLLVACLSAYGIADFARDEPVYEALLARDLRRAEDRPELEDTLLLDLTVAPGAEFEGKTVRQLGLPPGCILVAVRRGRRSRVPTADTRLEAGDQLTAVIAPEASAAIELLQRGTSAPIRSSSAADGPARAAT
jgi:chloride channel protein, CIC family